MILIGGSTGQLGKEVVAQLLRHNAKERFVALARDPDKAKIYIDQGIEVRYGDFDDPGKLTAVFDGIDRFLFISTMSTNRGEQQGLVVDAARAAGVRHIVYTGLAIRDIERSGVRDLMASHFETEDRIRESGMKWTFLRNTMYAEAIAQIIGPQALSDGIFLPGGIGRVPYALRTEMGEATANLLLQEGHEGKIYQITGNSAWSYTDIAASLSRMTGRNIPYKEISEEALAATLRASGMPDFPIWLTLGTIRDIRNGQYEITSHDLEMLLGRAPKSLDQMLSAIFA
ncbi:MAG: SDR family oxidoreductase [Sphingobium sp.]|nr:SDR family oxidoreductase [Sphingobium sp.]